MERRSKAGKLCHHSSFTYYVCYLLKKTKKQKNKTKKNETKKNKKKKKKN